MNLAAIRKRLDELERAPIREREPLSDWQFAARLGALYEAGRRPGAKPFERRAVEKLEPFIQRARERMELL